MNAGRVDPSRTYVYRRLLLEGLLGGAVQVEAAGARQVQKGQRWLQGVDENPVPVLSENGSE